MRAGACVLMAVVACGPGKPGPAPAVLVINEVLFDPVGDDAGNEWIEVHNPGPAPARLAGWRLVTRQGTTPLPDTTLAAGAYLTVPAPLADDRDGVALHRCAGSGCLADYVEYAFVDGAPEPPGRAEAVQAGQWPAAGAISDGLFAAEGDTLGRDASSRDTNTVDDWAGFGGPEAAGATPGAKNFDPLAYLLQDGAGDPCTRPPPRLDDRLRRYLEQVLAALRQIREQHRDLFGGLDGDLGLAGEPRQEANGDIVIGTTRIRLQNDLNPGGRGAGGRTCPPAQPGGETLVLLDPAKLTELWQIKDALIHELVHVALDGKPDHGLWRPREGGRFPDSGVRELVNPIHECICYVINLSLLERLLREFPAQRRDIEKRMKKKVQYLEEFIGQALRNLPELGRNTFYGRVLQDLFDRYRRRFIQWKAFVARLDGRIERRERDDLNRVGRALGLSEAELLELIGG